MHSRGSVCRAVLTCALVSSPAVLQAEPAVATEGPAIKLWYGQLQEFGRIGAPQPMINIPGNVFGPRPIVSLYYSLNGGQAQPLGIGPDGFRLHAEGDFNIELALADLPPGESSVTITAVDGAGASDEEVMTVFNASGAIWPLPYTIDWSGVFAINSVAQVTDGWWVVSGDGVRSISPGYDRLIAVGDQSWEAYEVTVPIIVHSIDPAGFDAHVGGPAVGVLLRWVGHSDDGSQPRRGVFPLGAIGLYHWTTDRNRFEVFGNGGRVLDSTPPDAGLDLGVAHMFKMRVEEISPDTVRYAFKSWPQSQAEPTEWLLVGRQGIDQDPGRGSVLLLSHYVDATFGRVEIVPLHHGSLTVQLEPADARSAGAGWRRVGTDIWHSDGAVEPGLPAGPLLVEFKPAAGFIRPDPVLTTALADRTATVSATYAIDTGTVPIALDQSITVRQDESQIVRLSATEPAGRPLTFSVPQPPGHGSLSDFNSSTGQAVYTPEAGYAGDDSFVFSASNGENSSSAVVTVTVQAAATPKPPPVTTYALTINTTTGAEAPAPTVHEAGTVVRVTAPPAMPGYAFTHWSGPIESTSTALDVTMDRDITLTANYAINPIPPTEPESSIEPPPMCGGGILVTFAAVALGRLRMRARRRHCDRV